MFLKGFCLLTLSFIISTFQVSNAARDGKLTVVNVYSGLESVDGRRSSLRNFNEDDEESQDLEDEEDEEDEENEEEGESLSDEEGEEGEEGNEEDSEECCKVTYGNPKVLGSNLRKDAVKPVARGNKKKKKHAAAHKKAYYNTKPENTETPVIIASPKETLTAIPILSTRKENMNWNNFKKIVETLRMKH